MKPDPRIIDDISRVAGGAMNVLSGLREQILGDMRARFDEMAARLDLVPREDFERLEAQVKELQRRLDSASSAPKKSTAAAKPQKKAASKAAAGTAKKTGKKKA